MSKIFDVSINYFKKSRYIKAMLVEYMFREKYRAKEIVLVHNGVKILLFNITRMVFVLVKQFRPAVYTRSIAEIDRFGEIDLEKYPLTNGFTIELCAGLLDKYKPIEDVAAEEILEECGYAVDPQSLEKIVCYKQGPLQVGSQEQTLFYCEVTDCMRVETERREDDIEVVEMSIKDVEEYLQKRTIASCAMIPFGFRWFFDNKWKQFHD